MSTFQVLRIVIMIAGIFVAGVATGRYVAPPAHVVATNMEFSSRDGRVITPRFIVGYFDRRLGLSPAQKRAFLDDARRFVDEIAKTEPATRQRFDVFERYYPVIRNHLTPAQCSAFDKLTEEHKQRMATILNEQGQSK